MFVVLPNLNLAMSGSPVELYLQIGPMLYFICRFYNDLHHYQGATMHQVMLWLMPLVAESYNNIPHVIAQVSSEEDSAYASLTPTLEGREVVSDRTSALCKAIQSSPGKEINEIQKLRQNTKESILKKQ